MDGSSDLRLFQSRLLNIKEFKGSRSGDDTKMSVSTELPVTHFTSERPGYGDIKSPYQFNLRQCVRTVAKIELLEDAYDQMVVELRGFPADINWFLSHSTQCHWPVSYFECLGSNFLQSGITTSLSSMVEVVFKVLRTLQAMFIGVFRCFTHHYY